MSAAPMIASIRVFSAVSDIELCAYLLEEVSSPGGIQMSAGFEIPRPPQTWNVAYAPINQAEAL